MVFEFTIENRIFKADSQKGIDLSIPIRRDAETVNCYHIPAPKIEPLRIGDFIGSKAAGGPVNCENISFNPHGNGTHTECYGHISNPEKVYLHDCLKEYWFTAQVIEVDFVLIGEDNVINLNQIESKIIPGTQAIICRSKSNWNDTEKFNFSGSNPPHFSQEFMAYLVANNVKHILTDLPSIDKEEDGGALIGHHTFFNYPSNVRKDCTITELISVPKEVEEGAYLLNLMIAGFDTDASPSKPIIYPLF